MASKLETDFNTPPYFNTYDEDDNYHRVLFKPGVALQSRELLEAQDILQDQIGIHGNHSFKDGSIITGCAFTLDTRTRYAKFPDLNSNGQEINISELTTGNVVMFNPADQRLAFVLDGIEGLESQNPDLKTIYFKYISGSANPLNPQTGFDPEDEIYFINRDATTITVTMSDTSAINTLSSNISVFQAVSLGRAAVTVVNSTALTFSSLNGFFTNSHSLSFTNSTSTSTVNVSTYSVDGTYLKEVASIASNTTFFVSGSPTTRTMGTGARALVTDGVIFQKGHFVRVDEQSVVVEKYLMNPRDAQIGFYTKESIVNSSVDSTLLDSASGYSNRNAPGADRLKLSPQLVSLNTAAAIANSQFYPIVVYRDGLQQQYNVGTQLNILGDVLARRTREESGDYVVEDFTFTTERFGVTNSTSHAAIGDDFNRMIASPGVAYVKGYRVESQESRFGFIRKATDTANLNNQSIFTNYQNSIHLDEFMGSFEFTAGQTINLHDTDPTALSSDGDYDDGLTGATISGDIIGTARIRAVERIDGILGTPDGQVKINIFDIRMNEGQAIGSAVAVSQGSGPSSYTAIGTIVPDTNGKKVRGASGNIVNGLLFDTGAVGVKTITDASLITRTTGEITIAGQAGSLAISNNDVFPYGAGDPTPARNEFLVTPVNSFRTSAITGTVGVQSGNVVVTGTATDFIGDLVVGQYIHIATVDEIVRVEQINSSTEIEVDPAPSATSSGHLARYAYPKDVPIDLEQLSDQVTVTVGSNSNTVSFDFGATVNASANVTVSYNKKITSATHKSKTFPAGGDNTKWVYIDISAAADKDGPWSLSVADVFSVQKIYGSSSGTDISSATDISSSFEFDNGQTRDYYGLGSIRKKRNRTIDLSSYDYLVVQFKYFEHGVGDYFSVDSYSVDDTTTPTPDDFITTQQIPVFNNPGVGRMDLRNYIDLRPAATNNVTPGANVANAVEAGNSTLSFGVSDKIFPAPNERFDYDIEFYLPRKDLITIEASGSLQITEGRPSLEPKYPKDVTNALTIARVEIPVFPSLDARTAKKDDRTDYLMKIMSVQPRRYTMKDIGQIDARVKALEYEVSLNKLERIAADTVIPAEANTAVERFKTSIVVDELNDLRKTDIDNIESRTFPGKPRKSSVSASMSNVPITLVANTVASNNVTDTARDIVTIFYNNQGLVQQPRASRQRNLLQDEFGGIGVVDSFPSYDNYYSTRTPALNTGEVGIEIPPQSRLSFGVADQADYLNQSIESYTVTTTDDEVQDTPQQIAVGDFVRDMRVIPFMRSREILLRATGLIPNVYHTIFMGLNNINAFCVPVTMKDAPLGKYINPTTQDTYLHDNWRLHSDQFFGRGTRGTYQYRLNIAVDSDDTGQFGRPIGFRADADGTILVNFLIPDGQFYIGNHRIVFTSANNYSGISTSDSVAFGDYNAYNFRGAGERVYPSPSFVDRSNGSSAASIAAEQSPSSIIPSGRDDGGEETGPGVTIGRDGHFPRNEDGSFVGFDNPAETNPSNSDTAYEGTGTTTLGGSAGDFEGVTYDGGPQDTSDAALDDASNGYGGSAGDFDGVDFDSDDPGFDDGDVGDTGNADGGSFDSGVDDGDVGDTGGNDGGGADDQAGDGGGGTDAGSDGSDNAGMGGYD